MDVRPVAGGPGGADPTQGAAAAPVIGKAAPPDKISVTSNPISVDAAFLEALSERDLARLLSILEPAQSAQTVSRVEGIAQAAIAAVSVGDIAKAIDQVSQLAAMDPARAEALRDEPSLGTVRPQIDSLLGRLTHVATLDAESRIAHATHVVEDRGVNLGPEWQVRPAALLEIANRLLESGGYVNAVRAAHVAQVIVDGAHWAPAAVPIANSEGIAPESEGVGTAPSPIHSAFRQALKIIRSAAPGRMAALWQRAPLLVLLAGWLAAGVLGGSLSWIQRRLWPNAWPVALNDAGFTVWALGFLALVLFGFYTRIRNVRL